MLTPTHLQEWLGSGVDLDLINLNVKSLSGTVPHDHLLYSPDIPRRNTGALSLGYFRKYRHCERGGWWCSGLDPLDDWEDARWGQFKADSPRTGEDGKPIKYEQPPKVPTRAYFLRVPLHIWQRVSERCGIPMPKNITVDPETGEAKGFWQWVQENPVPLMKVEGAKKAGCLLTQGIVAIGLPGITGAIRTKDALGIPVAPYLIPDLVPFATLGRQNDICFDQDSKPKTRKAVATEIDKLGTCLTKKGCSVRVISWKPELGKGVDDLIVSQGPEAFEIALENAPFFHTWQAIRYNQLTYKPSVTVNQRYLDIRIPAGEKLVCLKSPKGTGKTQSLEELVKEAQYKGIPVLLITHRVQLGEELCNRLGIPYVTELSECEYGKALGYGLCIDSLHGESQARFNPECWDDCIVILDECEQVIWHALSASTEVKRHRIRILDNLATLLKNVLNSESGQVILADADLSDLSIDFVKGLAEKPDLTPWVVLNEWKPTEEFGWQVYNYCHGKPEAWFAALKQHIAEGGRPFVQLSAQKPKSKMGTMVLERLLRKKFPDKKILRIDAESIADPTHPAFGCINRLNEVLPLYDIVLASPAIETGVSITLKNHFTSVWGCFQGVQPENSVRQALSRLRQPVERHIWAKSYGQNKIGNGAASAKALVASQHKLSRHNIQLLQDAAFDDIDTNPNATALWTWAKMAARINLGMNRYRDTIMESLAAEGHHITDISDDLDPDDKVTVRQEVKATRDEVWYEESEAIAKSELVSSREYEQLKQKKSKKPSERRKERRYELGQKYSGVDITAALVMDDDQGLYPQLLLHYYLTLGNPFLKQRDTKVLEAQLKAGNEKLWMPDFNRSQLGLKIKFLQLLGVPNLLNPHREFRHTDADLNEMAALAKRSRHQIKLVLGITIGELDSPILVAQRLLAKLGLKLTCIKREGSNGNRCRVYKFIPVMPPCKDWRGDLFAAWYERDEQSLEMAA